jgi:ribonuclease-3
LFTAFTHTSYANEHFVASYERLEFLGDSVLNFVTADRLFKRYNKEAEGFLTKARARIVSGATLSKVVCGMDLLKFMRTSLGSIETEVKGSTAVQSDLYESIVAAIFLDGGLKAAERFILKTLGAHIDAEYTREGLSDFKSQLLEYAAKNRKSVSFEFRQNEKDRTFTVTAYMEGRAYGVGRDISKKKAEQISARQTLEILNII